MISPMVNVTEIEGRGRSVVSTQALKGGDIILKDSPILLYSSFPLSPPQAAEQNYCSHCFRSILSLSISPSCPCPECSISYFCSSNCWATARNSSHTPWVCQSLKHLREVFSSSPIDKDLHVQSRYLIAAYNLASIDPSNFKILLSLQGDHTSVNGEEARYLHSLISPLNPTQIGFSVELTAALLAKDKLNAFGLMEPVFPGKERSVRAYGIYPRASFFNHDCLPNACRFDYVDIAHSPENTEITIRVLHDLPQGREICLSYFPVNMTYPERQSRLKEDYGFVCECDRCKVEANWSDQEEDDEDEKDDDMEADEADMEADEAEMDADVMGDETSDNDFPHAYFFIKYMCNRNSCCGTLAPVSSLAKVMECNVCGSLSKSDIGNDFD